MIALIDGDVLCYQVAFVTEKDEEYVAKTVLRNKIHEILQAVNADDYEIWLTDSKMNWRLALFPQYKANRTQPKPKHYHLLLNNMTQYWKADVAEEGEADDALGIRQTYFNSLLDNPEYGDTGSCICTIDKDLQQIPGNHYNFDKRVMSYVTPSEGIYRFYSQLLMGDSGDNITPAVGLSCKGVGKKKAERILEGCDTDVEMAQACYDMYLKQWAEFPIEEINKKFLVTGQLIKIRTKEGEVWTPPIKLIQSTQKPEEVVQQ